MIMKVSVLPWSKLCDLLL